jgi:hypothetical protein
MSGMPGSGPSPAFTRESANAVLPQLRTLLPSLRDAYAVAAGAAEGVRTLAAGNGGTHNAQEWADAEHVVAQSLTWLRERGILLKDIEQGLIDFPAIRDGRTVLLCWKLGEPSVDHWHEVTSGFAGRRPL